MAGWLSLVPWHREAPYSQHLWEMVDIAVSLNSYVGHAANQVVGVPDATEGQRHELWTSFVLLPIPLLKQLLTRCHRDTVCLTKVIPSTWLGYWKGWTIVRNNAVFHLKYLCRVFIIVKPVEVSCIILLIYKYLNISIMTLKASVSEMLLSIITSELLEIYKGNSEMEMANVMNWTFAISFLSNQ